MEANDFKKAVSSREILGLVKLTGISRRGKRRAMRGAKRIKSLVKTKAFSSLRKHQYTPKKNKRQNELCQI